jgi:hypothetical protein
MNMRGIPWMVWPVRRERVRRQAVTGLKLLDGLQHIAQVGGRRVERDEHPSEDPVDLRTPDAGQSAERRLQCVRDRLGARLVQTAHLDVRAVALPADAPSSPQEPRGGPREPA